VQRKLWQTKGQLANVYARIDLEFLEGDEINSRNQSPGWRYAPACEVHTIKIWGHASPLPCNYLK